MSEHVPHRLIDASLGQPWLIDRSALESICAIVSRATSSVGLPVLVPPAVTTIADGGVARIPIRGPILRYASVMTTHCGASALDRISADFDSAMMDSSVRRIELVIDSPGGQAAGIETFADRVYAARARKKVTARVESMCASAAFWVASAADEIEISETASLGSVGVVLTVQRGGRGDLEIVSSQSPKKRQSADSPEGRADLQALVDQLAEVFVGRVARNRGVSVEHVLAHFGQGWIKTGRDAIAARMADRFDTGATLPPIGGSGARAETPEAQWDRDDQLRVEFGYNRERWLAYRRSR